MVQSIWLQFHEKQLTHEIIPKIIDTVKSVIKCYSYEDEKKMNAHIFRILDYQKIMTIIQKLGLKIDDTKKCDCGCYSTELEQLLWNLSPEGSPLEFDHGCILNPKDYKGGLGCLSKDIIQALTRFCIGKDLWGTGGHQYERALILREILTQISIKLKQLGIDSELDLSDCPDINEE